MILMIFNKDFFISIVHPTQYALITKILFERLKQDMYYINKMIDITFVCI